MEKVSTLNLNERHLGRVKVGLLTHINRKTNYFSGRVTKRLIYAELNYVYKIVLFGLDRLRFLPGIGQGSCKEIEDYLEEYLITQKVVDEIKAYSAALMEKKLGDIPEIRETKSFIILERQFGSNISSQPLSCLTERTVKKFIQDCFPDRSRGEKVPETPYESLFPLERDIRRHTTKHLFMNISEYVQMYFEEKMEHYIRYELS